MILTTAARGHTVLGVRRGSIVIGLTIAIVGIVPAFASAASVYDPANCIHVAPAGWITAPSQPSDQFVVHAPAAEANRAADAASEIRSKGFFAYYESHLKIGGLGYLGQTGRFDVYLDPDLRTVLPKADGVNASSCENPGRDAVDVYAGITSADAFHATLAHELFHAAQARLGGNFKDNWFFEATATWAESRFGYSDPRAYSTQVTEHPGIAIDSFSPAVDGADAHEYGAWTFVAWLFSRSKIGWDDMRSVFGDSAQADPTPILDGRLSKTTVADEVASFWADHTNAKPKFGPKTPITPTVVAQETDSFTLPTAPYLAARLPAFKLAPSRKQLVVVIHKLAPGLQVWLNLGGDEFITLHEGESMNDTFCRGAATAGSYALPKNGVLPLAITTTAKSAPADLKLKFFTSSKPCPKPLVIQPGLAVGPLHLGMSLHAADQALPKRTPLNGPVPTPYGAYTVADYREAAGAGAIAGFLDGRIAFLFVESPKFATTTHIHTLTILPPIPGAQAFVPASTIGQLGSKHCAPIADKSVPSEYCWKEGPKTRYTAVMASNADPCPRFDDEPPPCTFPRDDYVWGIAVATSKGLKLAHFGINLFGAPV